MRFIPSDWLVHPQHGVGHVVKLQERKFGEESPKEYYEIAIAKGTVWVPVEGPANGLRKVTAKAELHKYRGLLRAHPVPVALDSKERKQALLERLKEGSFRTRCELVRDLTAHGWDKPLNESTGATLRVVRQEVCSEWAAAEGVSLEVATREVDNLLLEGRAAFKA
jgi:RNA polymerase-interacting CarD/CdnL/TRCF family regulator